MNLLITGANGFVGTRLIRSLIGSGENKKLYAVTRELGCDRIPSVTYVIADCSCSGWTKSIPPVKFDAVIHLAQSNYYRDFPDRADDVISVNVLATHELAQWALANKVPRMIFTSSGNVYGSSEEPHNEDDPCFPDAMYGASKLAAEILIKPYAEFFEIIIARLFGVYGPGQRKSLLPNMIERFTSGSQIVLAENIGVSFNPIYIDDCVEVLKSLLEIPMPDNFFVLNVGGTEVVDLHQIVMLLDSMLGGKPNLYVTNEAPVRLVGNVDKMLRLGLVPNVKFDDGLRRTCASIG